MATRRIGSWHLGAEQSPEEFKLELADLISTMAGTPGVAVSRDSERAASRVLRDRKREAERAKAGRARGAKRARDEKKKQRKLREAQRAERRRDADVRYLIREGDSDRDVASKMRDRAEKLHQPHLKIGRKKIAEIRRAMPTAGPG